MISFFPDKIIIMIKVGIKFGPRSSLEDFEKLIIRADFVELYGKVGFDYSFIKRYKKPVTIHCPHHQEGVNLANKDRAKKNEEAIVWSKKTADFFESKVIVIHSDLKEKEDDSLENTISFLNKYYDSRFHIENMPFISEGYEHFGRTFKEIKKVMNEAGVSFCLDLAHASEFAMYKKIDVIKYLKKLLTLNPSYYHFSDANINLVSRGINSGYHLNIGDGDLDVNLLKSLIPDKALVALETKVGLDKQIKDIEFLKK